MTRVTMISALSVASLQGARTRFRGAAACAAIAASLVIGCGSGIQHHSDGGPTDTNGGEVAPDMSRPLKNGEPCSYQDMVCDDPLGGCDQCKTDCITHGRTNCECACYTCKPTPGVVCGGQCAHLGVVECGGKCIVPDTNDNCGGCGVRCQGCDTCKPSGDSYACAPDTVGIACGGTFSGCGSGPPKLICHCPATCECNGGEPSCVGGTYECWCNGVQTGVTCTNQGDCCCGGNGARCTPGGC